MSNQIESEIDNIISTTTQNLEPIAENIMEENTIDNKVLNNENIEVFNTALHQYLRINEEIKTLMQAIKTRNEIKKNLGETISTFLKTNQIKNVNLDGSYKGKRLESVLNTTITGFNKTNITEAIYNELKEDQEILDKIMQALSRTTIMKETWKLKIVEEKTTPKNRKQKNNILDQATELLNN
jgi:hypothetical protein